MSIEAAMSKTVQDMIGCSERDRYRDGLHQMIPHYMHEALINYLERGAIPGDFLQAVISHNFCVAVTRADGVNEASLRQYAIFLLNFVPDDCHGSRKKMIAWNKRGGLLGRKA